MTDTEIVETPTVDSTTTTAVEQPKETFDQTLERVASEAFDGKRGADGKFQSRDAAQGAPETVKVPGSPQAAPPDPAAPVIEAPQSLPADVKAEWAKLPPSVQKYWSDRESEIHKKFTTDGERLKTLTAYEEVTKPIEGRLKQLNAPASEYFRRLAAADQLLSSDGLNGIRQIAQMYGIDLRSALQIGTQPGPQPTPQIPDIDKLVDQKLEQREQERAVTHQQGEIDKFRAALPADEQTDFDKLEAVMVGLKGANPSWKLEDLYKAARKVDADTSAKDEAKAAEAKRKEAEAEAKKKAAQDARLGPLSQRPGSAPTGPIKGKSIWETMDKVGKEVMARN